MKKFGWHDDRKHVLITCCLIGAMILTSGCGNKAQSKLAPERPEQTFNEEPTITLYLHETGETVSLPLEEYLCGVVAAEMATDWPGEALAAQAIMARTFTLEKILAGGVPDRGTDASTDVAEFQAYDATKINDAVRQAVQETRGRVVRSDGQLIKAWFFADGGGVTAASSKEGLGYDKEPTPYIHSVEDPGEQLADNPNKAWQAVFPLETVRTALVEMTGRELAIPTEAAIAEQGPSGRATKLSFNGYTVSAPALRLALDSTKMKSTLLTNVQINDGTLIMEGKGYGHGVGMSQWGARAMAEDGKSADEIVHYFFKDVEITQEYE